MQMSEYVTALQTQLAVAAAPGGEEARALADRLTAPLDAAVRLVLLDAMSAAADEITRELAPGTVEVRLRGGEPEFVVTLPPDDHAFQDVGGTSEPPPVAPADDDGGTSRLNLRLPDALKQRIDEAAASEGLSLNAWLVRAATSALGKDTRSQRRNSSGGDHFSGWVR